MPLYGSDARLDERKHDNRGIGRIEISVAQIEDIKRGQNYGEEQIQN